MADKGHHAAHAGHGSHDEAATAGTMDISDHIKTWHAFWNGTKYSVVGLIVIAAILALFRTHNG
jgi:hypothetical protein